MTAAQLNRLTDRQMLSYLKIVTNDPCLSDKRSISKIKSFSKTKSKPKR